MQSRLVVIALAGCGSFAPLTQVALPAPTACASAPSLPRLDPRFAPAVTGAVSVVSAEGDARLSATELLPVTWSADSAYAASIDHSWVTLWRVSDGEAVEHVACPAAQLGHLPIAISADLRWIAAPGVQHDAREYRSVVCLVDRAAHAARVLAGDFSRPRFDGDTLIGVDRSIDLATGETTLRPPAAETPAADTPVTDVEVFEPPPAGIDPEGAQLFAVSHDGRYVAGWTAERIDLEGDSRDTARAPPEPPEFLAVWDRATGARLWRDTTRWHRSWQFSADDRFLEAAGTAELLRASSGEVLTFPGTVSPVSPDGQRVLVYAPGGFAPWSIEPRRPLLEVPRPRTIVARSGDGAAGVALDGDHLVIERSGRCLALGVQVRVYDAIAFSPDGRELYAGLDSSGPPPADPRKQSEHDWPSKRTLAVWRTDTGEVASSISVVGRAAVYPMPAARQVAFAIDNKLAVLDARTGRTVRAMTSAWVSRPPVFAHHLVLGPRNPIEQFADDITETFYGPVMASATARHPHGRAAVALAPGERHLAAVAGDGQIMLWDRDRKAIRVAAPHAGEAGVLAFSPDGRLLAVGGDAGSVTVIEAATGATFGTIALAGDHATLLWWSADGARLVIDTARRFRITIAPRPRG
jgi:hypothetical protein